MTIDLKGPEGNAFALIGLVKKVLKETDQESKVEEILTEMIEGDYENLVKVARSVLEPFGVEFI